MDLNWVVAALPMILLLLIAIFMRGICKNWLEPGAFFPLVVSVYFLAPIIIVPYYYVSPIALWWVFLSTLAFICGSLIVNLKSSYITGCDKLKRVTISDNIISLFPRLRTLTIFSTMLGCTAALAFILFFNRNIGTIFQLHQLMETGAEVSKLRYTGYYNPPVYLQLLLIFVYLSPMLGGIEFSVREKRVDILLSIASLIPSILIFLIHTTRAAAYIGIILWVASYFTVSVYALRGKGIRLFTKKKIIVFLSLALVILVLFLFGEIARKREIPSLEAFYETINLPRTRSTLFGHVTAYSVWFQDQLLEEVSPALGAFTFGGIFDTLGIRERRQGLYYERVSTEGYSTTNIYTIYRGFIEDFTMPGSLVFLFALGIFSSLLFLKVSSRHLVAVPFLILLYAFLSWPIVSILNYSSIIFAFIILIIYNSYANIIYSGSERKHEAERLNDMCKLPQ